MKTLESKVEDVLDNLEVPYLSVNTSGETVVVTLDGDTSLRDITSRVQADPRYDHLMHPHREGFHLLFENVSAPQEKALLDYALDFRGQQGRLLSVRASLKMGKIFSHTGRQIICLSIKDLSLRLREELEEMAISQEVESLE